MRDQVTSTAVSLVSIQLTSKNDRWFPQECLQHYETALDYCKRELQNDEAYLSAITVTITYNLARLYEALHEFGKV